MDPCSVNISSVMAAVDMSRYSEAVFSHAAVLARSLGARLILLHVIDHRGLEYMDELGVQGFHLSKESYVRTLTERQQTTMGQEFLPHLGGMEAQFIIRVGVPYQEIVKAVRDLRPSLLVMGPKGLSAVEGILFGSTAEKVFRLAGCPVLSVRGPEHCTIPDFD